MSVRRSLESDRGLNIDETRLVADLRVMHAKVDELYHIVENLKRRHSNEEVHRYADASVLAENIGRVDEIYLWFVRLKADSERGARRGKLLSVFFGG